VLDGNSVLDAAVWLAQSGVFAVAISPLIGSFLGVLVTRMDRPGSILLGRSACPSCGGRLGPFDLVPVVSWLVLRGSCRHCSRPISPFYPLIELAAVAVALWAAMLVSGSWLWASLFLGWALLALAATDAREFVLPDFLTLPLTLAGLAVGWALDPASLPDRAVGAAAGFFLVILLRWAYWRLRRREGIGLGDAKLLAAAGAWVSWEGLPSVVLLAALFGLGFALILHWRKGGVSLADRVPFGTFLCIGIWIVWLYGPLG
jgi:leader peptidase (prepilin peptidase) / N-methyltransferase